MKRFRFPTLSAFVLCLGLVVSLAGCQSSGMQTFWRGPFMQDYGRPGNTQTFQKPPNDGSGLSRKAPPKENTNKPQEQKTGPEFPEAKKQPAKLTLTVTAPKRVQLGSRVAFESVITNTGGEAATDVVIGSKFNNEFQFPKQSGDVANQTLGTILPGASRPVVLSLIANKTGNRCVEFTVKSGPREAVWKSVCVDVEQPRYQLQVFTPPKRHTGDLIELTTLLANISDDGLTGVTVTVAFDSRLLAPFEASKGAKQEDGRLTWNVNKLNAAMGIPLQAEFRCLKPVRETCIRITVTGDDAPSEIRETCFAIAEQSELIGMQLSDTNDLLAVGDETDVEVTLTNRTTRRIAGEPLEINVPSNFRVVSTSVERDKTALAAKYEVKDGRVTFEPIPMTSPGDQLTYHVKLKALRAEQSDIQATLRPGKKPLLQLSEPVTVN